MDKELCDFFASLAPFSEEELSNAGKFFHLRTLMKKEYFCKEGYVSRDVAFVSRGILRSFFVIGEKETTTFFQKPQTIVVALRSFVKGKAAMENIQAITDAEIISISRTDLYRLYEGSWKWQQVGRMIIENYYIQQEKRMLLNQSLSAKERYEEFSTSNPEVLKTVPLQYIASLLGISPETLSRIRGSR